jgi:hypothetical protein
MYPNVFADKMECKAVHQWGKKYSSNSLKRALQGALTLSCGGQES